jgi:hypothetical protein
LAAIDWTALDRLVNATEAARQPPALLQLLLSQAPAEAKATTRQHLI